MENTGRGRKRIWTAFWSAVLLSAISAPLFWGLNSLVYGRPYPLEIAAFFGVFMGLFWFFYAPGTGLYTLKWKWLDRWFG